MIKGRIVPKSTGRSLMTRGVPIIGNNPKGQGIVKNNVIIRTRRKNLRAAYA